MVEDFARQIPKDIVKTEIIHEAPRSKPIPKPAVDYELINNIMNNKYKSDKGTMIEEKKEIKPRVSEYDKDIINRIMTNRFGKKSEGNNKNKKEEK